MDLDIDLEKLFRLKNLLFNNLINEEYINRCSENQTVSGHIYIPDTEGESGLLDQSMKWLFMSYLKCGLHLNVTVVREECYETQDLCFSCFGNEEIIKTTDYGIHYIDYLLDILSVLNFQKDLTYFSYLNLFSSSIWLILFISAITYGILFRKFILIDNNSLSYILLVIMSCPSNLFLKSNVSIIRRRIFVFLIVIWLITSTILIMAFKSILLNVYYLKKPSLTVHTFEDIVSNPKLFVSGFMRLQTLKDFKPIIYSDLRKRAKNYERLMDIDLESSNHLKYAKNAVIKDIVEQKAVLIISSIGVELYKTLYPESNLKGSEDRSFQEPYFFYISKNHSHSKSIYNFFKRILENGMYRNYFSIHQTMAEIYGKTKESLDPQLIAFDSSTEEPIKLDIFFRGPTITLIVGLTLSIVLFLFEISKKYIEF